MSYKHLQFFSLVYIIIIIIIIFSHIYREHCTVSGSVIETSEQKAEEYNLIHNEEKGRGDENHAVCTSYTHIRALCACTEYPCSGYLRISLRADGFGSDTERHADHDRCRDQYVVFRRRTCACCGNNADGRLSLVFRAVEDLRRGMNTIYPLFLCMLCHDRSVFRCDACSACVCDEDTIRCAQTHRDVDMNAHVCVCVCVCVCYLCVCF